MEASPRFHCTGVDGGDSCSGLVHLLLALTLLATFTLHLDITKKLPANPSLSHHFALSKKKNLNMGLGATPQETVCSSPFFVTELVEIKIKLSLFP